MVVETFANDDAGHDALGAKLAGVAVELIVMEATGEYSIQLAAMISKRCPDLFPAIANPQVDYPGFLEIAMRAENVRATRRLGDRR